MQTKYIYYQSITMSTLNSVLSTRRRSLQRRSTLRSTSAAGTVTTYQDPVTDEMHGSTPQGAAVPRWRLSPHCWVTAVDNDLHGACSNSIVNWSFSRYQSFPKSTLPHPSCPAKVHKIMCNFYRHFCYYSTYDADHKTDVITSRLLLVKLIPHFFLFL